MHYQVADNHVIVHKGTNSDVDSYSAFWDNNKLSQTKLVSELTKRGVTDVYVCGLAYDVCVGEYQAVQSCHRHGKVMEFLEF